MGGSLQDKERSSEARQEDRLQRAQMTLPKRSAMTGTPGGFAYERQHTRSGDLLPDARQTGLTPSLVCAVVTLGGLLDNSHMPGFEGAALLQGGTSAAVISYFLLLPSRSDRR
jgi:hypothetical protein